LKLVGAVAIKLRPDATGFKKDAEAKLKKETKDLSADVELKPKVDTEEAKVEVEKAKEEMEKKVINLRVGVDYDSIRRAQDQLDAAIKNHEAVTITVNLNDPADVEAKLAELQAMEHDSEVNVKFTPDEKGYREVLAKIDAVRRQQAQVEIGFGIDEASLTQKEFEIKALLGGLVQTIELRYNTDRAGLEKVIAEIDAELRKIHAVALPVDLDEASLLAAKGRMETELNKLPVRIEYDENLASLELAKARIEELLRGGKLHIETNLDETSLLEAKAQINAMIHDIEGNKVKIKPAISAADYLTTVVALRELTKNQTVTIFTKLNDASLLLAAAKLTGLRAASSWTKEFAETIGTLDRNLPIVAGATLAISQLSAGVLDLTSNIFSLGNGVGEVARMGLVLAPALILGLSSMMIVMKGVFKDFGAAVNGDKTAIKALTESGKQAAAEIRPIFQSIRETVSKNFWDQASDSMLRFVQTALPAFGKGLGQLAGTMGNVFGTLLDSFSNLSQQGGVAVFFANLTHGLDLAKGGLARFMDAFNTLAVVGSTVFPRMGRAFSDWADHFNSWIQGLAADGTLNRWIDTGIQGLKDLVDSGVNLIKVWGNIGQAAQAAGGMTLHSFSAAIAKLDEITSGGRFQKNMTTLFEGGAQASKIFYQALGGLGPAMDVFVVTAKNAMINAAHALAPLIAIVGDALSSPRLGVGLAAFLAGVQKMFQDLRPAAAPIVQILETMGKLMGAVASDTGPLFRNLFEQIATVFSAAYRALAPFLPQLILLGTAVVNTLGPAFLQVVQAVIPSFAGGLQRLGDGILPLIHFLADAAVNITNFVTSLQPGTIAEVAGVIFSLGGAMQFAGAVVPVVTAALKGMGIAAGITAVETELMIPVIGLLTALLTGLAIGAVTLFATSQHNAIVDANEYRDALIEDGKAAGGLADAIGEATTKTAINALVQAGAYDKAHRLGISTQELTDAVLKGGPAMISVQTKIQAANKAYNESADAANKVAAGQFRIGDAINKGANPALKEQADLGNALNGIIDQQTGNLEASKTAIEAEAEARKAAGIPTDAQKAKLTALTEQLNKTTAADSAAAQASGVLSNALSSSSSKVDAMRTTFALLLGPNAKQQAAETLGAYAKGFNDLKDTVAPVKDEMAKLGAAAFGEDGFLNVASGNKAILQVNQALVDEVNNVWSGAKAAFDTAEAQGKTAAQAFADAQKFIDNHHDDFNQLATASGVDADKVQGQWDAVFGHPWVLKVSMEGATEAATRAQEMFTALGGHFDGEKFQLWLDMNPAEALKGITDAKGAALDFVNGNWQAILRALPKPAQDAIRGVIDVTDADWNNGNFEAILKASQNIPGLSEALKQIFDGVKATPEAIIFAVTNKVSLAEAQAELDALAARRTAQIDVIVKRGDMSDLNGDASGNGRFGSIAIGAILDSLGRGLQGFAPIYKAFANGGIENHIAQIARPGIMPRVWAESETGGEAYLPLHPAKRVRSVAILKQVASMFGYQISKAQSFMDGGTTVAPSNTSYHAPVHIGQLITTDPDAAVEALQRKRRDAMAVHNIRAF
jgi:hypothetical protein